jgi:hypothetical protein
MRSGAGSPRRQRPGRDSRSPGGRPSSPSSRSLPGQGHRRPGRGCSHRRRCGRPERLRDTRSRWPSVSGRPWASAAPFAARNQRRLRAAIAPEVAAPGLMFPKETRPGRGPGVGPVPGPLALAISVAAIRGQGGVGQKTYKGQRDQHRRPSSASRAHCPNSSGRPSLREPVGAITEGRLRRASPQRHRMAEHRLHHRRDHRERIPHGDRDRRTEADLPRSFGVITIVAR